LKDSFGFQLWVNQCEFFELHLISIFIKIILTLLDFGLKQEVLGYCVILLLVSIWKC
jgi:hypothetical protein